MPYFPDTLYIAVLAIILIHQLIYIYWMLSQLWNKTFLVLTLHENPIEGIGPKCQVFAVSAVNIEIHFSETNNVCGTSIFFSCLQTLRRAFPPSETNKWYAVGFFLIEFWNFFLFILSNIWNGWLAGMFLHDLYIMNMF